MFEHKLHKILEDTFNLLHLDSEYHYDKSTIVRTMDSDSLI